MNVVHLNVMLFSIRTLIKICCNQPDGISLQLESLPLERDRPTNPREIGKEQQPVGRQGRTKGRTEGRTKGRTEGRTEGLTEGRTEGLTEGRTEGLTEGREIAAERGLHLLREHYNIK